MENLISLLERKKARKMDVNFFTSTSIFLDISINLSTFYKID